MGQTTRRNFVKGAGVAAVVGACGASSLALADAVDTGMTFADTVPWNTQYDVVVVGWGGAGACAAVEAADKGAKVLLLEKAPYGDEGGNTRYCEQLFLTPDTYETGIAYMKAMAAGYDTATDEIIDYMVRGSLENGDWLIAHGAESFGPNPPSNTHAASGSAFPPLEEQEGFTIVVDGQLQRAGEYPIWPNGEPNDGRLQCFLVEAPDAMQKKYWNLMRRNVLDRKDSIDVWYESPAVRLVQDPFSKAVIGVVVDRGGEEINVRAQNGVVLACGSYEGSEEMFETFAQIPCALPLGSTYNTGDGIKMAMGVGADLFVLACGSYEGSEEMFETFAQIPCALPLGSTYNTGDGIKMAMGVGADLWHMDALSGPWPTAKYHNEQRGIFGGVMHQRLTMGGSCIHVGGNAKRFMKESSWHKHGHIDFGGTWMSQPLPDVMWAIFDEDARWSGGIIGFVEDEEIIQASSVEELAEMIGLDPATLRETVDTWNANVEAGEDPMGRPSICLAPLTGDTVYAGRLWPCFVKAQGGPKRNVRCEVLDTEGNPIPHLYSAGELGSFWAGVYQAGGNISETCYTGRTAGANAAEEKEPLPTIVLKAVESEMTDLGNDLDVYDVAPEVSLGENEYLGIGSGLHGDIVVKATVIDGTIENVEVISQNETAGITDAVWSDLPAAMIEANSTEVDGITGASISSRGLAQAVEDALAQAAQ